MYSDAQLPINEHSVLVRQTPTSFIRIARNQAHAGYSLVILREHVTDLTDLTPAQLAGFWTDVQHTGQAIQQTFEPKKIDYLVMGHRMPHVHCHLLPQHARDDPRRNPDISDGPAIAEPAELDRAARAMATAWERG